MKKEQYFCDVCGEELESPQQEAITLSSIVGFSFISKDCNKITITHLCSVCEEKIYRFIEKLKQDG